ncbi:MAG TPA: MerR family transcriptional regulator [Pseudonocardiaceae bacterium]|jgi:DNA-binding transcriptional MerR regulator|nr:MerR family transcriptional regulator [Pseudonocardiaceae bacterium]
MQQRSAQTIEPRGLSGPVGVGGDTERGYTVEELSRKVGMSPRNIRAHQARKLLPPPVRRGRVAYYDESHVRRLETIKGLQRQGFNLVSIEAMLGTHRSDRGGTTLELLIGRVESDHPALLYALTRHGVVGRTDDGVVRVVRPRALLSALDLHRIGLSPIAALRLLSELLDSTQCTAQHLVEAAGARLLALRPGAADSPRRASDALDADAAALTQGLVNVLSEVLRISVENRARTRVPQLLADGDTVDFDFDDDTADREVTAAC